MAVLRRKGKKSSLSTAVAKEVYSATHKNKNASKELFLSRNPLQPTIWSHGRALHSSGDDAATDVHYITGAFLAPTVLPKNREQGQLREKSSKPAVPFCIASSMLSSVAQVRVTK